MVYIVVCVYCVCKCVNLSLSGDVYSMVMCSSVQITLQQMFSKVVSVCFLEEVSFMTGSKLFATYGSCAVYCGVCMEVCTCLDV